MKKAWLLPAVLVLAAAKPPQESGDLHARLGTDFDGIEDPPDGLEDVSRLPVVTEELLRRGHSEEDVRGVLGENFLRFWERANAARPECRGARSRSSPGRRSSPI